MRKSFQLSKCLLLTLALCLYTCEPNERITPETSGSLLLGIELPESITTYGRIAVNDKLSIIITIENESGMTILDQEVLKLTKLNNEFITKPISLVSGNYKIVDFMVINDLDEVIYMTPKEGSHLAYLVDHPVPILFSITKNLITKLAPWVISTLRKSPKDFGYSSFAFTHVPTFDFLITLFTLNNETFSYELTDGSLQVKADGEVVFDSALYAGTVQITLPANHDAYELIVTKPWGTVTNIYTQDELEQHFSEADIGPLQIYITQPLWEYNTYGGGSEENLYEPPVFIGTSDGGFIFLNFGHVYGEYGEEILVSWIIKLSSEGVPSWGKDFYSYQLHSIANTNDGGYIVTGDGTIKTDAIGNIQWEKRSIRGKSVMQTQDKGFLVVGYVTATKLTRTGEVDWINEIGIEGHCAIEVLSGEGGFVIGGRTAVDDEFAATKISKEGEVIWLKSYGGFDYYNKITSIVHDGNDGFMMAGHYNVVCNISSDGSLIFLNRLTNRLHRTGAWHPSYIIPSSNGFIIGTTIYTNVDDYLSNCWIVEIDHQGIQLRDNIIERQGNYVTGGIAQSSDGYVVIGGNGLWAAKVRFDD